jgi:hypothetical protein
MPDEQIVNQTLNFTENYHGLVEDLLLNGDKNQLINSFSIILNQMALYDQELLMNSMKDFFINFEKNIFILFR